MRLIALPTILAVCRLAPDAPFPDCCGGEFLSITRTSDELSIVCAQAKIPEDIQTERDWRALRIQGTLDFSLTGILARIAAPLAEAGISIFAISTFDTDYVLVKADRFAQAVAALEAAGHQVDCP